MKIRLSCSYTGTIKNKDNINMLSLFFTNRVISTEIISEEVKSNTIKPILKFSIDDISVEGYDIFFFYENSAVDVILKKEPKSQSY